MTVTRPMLNISADFDSGNIQVIDASDPRHVRLAIRPDTHSDHFQWFHFKVANLSLGERHDFVLENAGQSSYNDAWHGYHAVASYDQKVWFRVPSQYDGSALRFGLEPTQQQIWFAYFEPYSRERHDWLVEQALNLAGMQLIAVRKSAEGREIPLLRKGDGAPGKRKIWLIAQQHPGEHMAEWFIEGIIERLQQTDDKELNALLAVADIYLIPHMNPDGAFHGHLRTNAMGKDLNRAWQDSSAEYTPEVFFAQQQMDKYGVDLFIDAHGDEAIPHVFTAACEGNPGYTPRIADLELTFRQVLQAQTPDFQTLHGYTLDEPGQANMTLACNSVGARFDCLAMTLEMPFKDHDDAPNEVTGWSGKRSAQLGKDVLSAIGKVVHLLR
ncbi:M14-type cytosolic carboxypeptidase [Pseudomonas sp. HR96]|uniref:M14 family metallopeptidase n=1 Tax=Pseudomonas sp. HR96 TaxID=1027966 RepID=UPI002A766154|nr:M14-type cytosolic carboxypeptidase [Pseudomonas sp. HR96]WPP01500.1 M14-type cytosolic carboxypeptidase [Pseudomonas sp. HR96]